MKDKYKKQIANLPKLSYDVTQLDKTEPPFNNKYDHHFAKGIYVDIVSRKVLFTSLDKFDSGCGWPAFSKPVNEEQITYLNDTTHGMVRTEVRSSDADSHLGHVFNDGPSGLRYCINSAALDFISYEQLEEQGYGEYLTLFDEEQ